MTGVRTPTAAGARGRTGARGGAEISLTELRRVGESLQGDFDALIGVFPSEARGASEMSRWLGVSRPVCQRLVAAVRRVRDGAEVVAALPGVKGLLEVVEKAKRKRCDETAVGNARRAVERYAGLIERCGGSQAELIRLAERVRSDAPPDDGGSAGARRAMFEAARTITDRWAECKFSVVALRPMPEDGAFIEHAAVTGYAGLNGGPKAQPVCQHTRLASGLEGEKGTSPLRSLSEGRPLQGATARSLVEEFCSRPLPRLSTRQASSGLLQVIEVSGAGDVVNGDRSWGGQHPRASDPPVVNLSTLADPPCKAMVLVVLLHRELARECVGTAGCYLLGARGTMASTVGPDGHVSSRRPTERWFDRAPEPVTLEELGPGLELLTAPAYPRFGALLRHLFSEVGWAPEDFIAYRVAAEYPVWNTEYLMSFDFAPGGADQD
jgi:hypothetical protein